MESGSEVFAILCVAFLFLWIAHAGSSRVLKVLDRRHYLLGTVSAANPFVPRGATMSTTQVSGGTPINTFRSSASITPRTSAVSGGGGGLYSAPLTDSILSDNRLLFGACAVLVGVLRASYILMIVYIKGTTNITGDNLTADTFTAPLAWLFYSLTSSILWALRDLLARVRSSIDFSSSSTAQSSMSNSPVQGLTPQRLGQNGLGSALNSAGTVESGEAGGIGDAPSCVDSLATTLKPFSAVVTSMIIFICIAVSLSGAWISKEKHAGDETASRLSVITSSVISFALFFWSVSSTAQAISLLRSVGIAAHKVVFAFVAMSIFLLVRGIIILPPVQEAMCGERGVDRFWSCTFFYGFWDAAGIAIILSLLP